MPPEELSIRQASLVFHFTPPHLQRLVEAGAVSVRTPGSPLRPLLCTADLEALQEGVHYVVCQTCGRRYEEIHLRHLQTCSQLTLAEYRSRYPDALVGCDLSHKLRIRSPETKEAQSAKMRQYFQTSEGLALRKTLSQNYQITPARQESIQAMVDLNRSPDKAARLSARMTALWADPDYCARRKESQSHLDLTASVTRARQFLPRRLSSPHRKLKKALEQAGVSGFLSEHPLGNYRIDEADPLNRIALEVQGCYWHGCPTCPIRTSQANVERDRAKKAYLEENGWRVVYVWEHDIKKDLSACVSLVIQAVGGHHGQVAS